MEILRLQSLFFEIGAQILGHFFGQSGGDDTATSGNFRLGFGDEILDLAGVISPPPSPLPEGEGVRFSALTSPFGGGWEGAGCNRPHGERRVHQTGRPDYLFHNLRAFFNFELGRRGAGVNHRADSGRKFVKLERPIVQGARQAEAVLNQSFFTTPVAGEHSGNLRNGHMRLVDDGQKVKRRKSRIFLGVGARREAVGKDGKIRLFRSGTRKIREQGLRRRAGAPPGKVAGIIFNPIAITDLLNHRQIVIGSPLQSIGLQ